MKKWTKPSALFSCEGSTPLVYSEQIWRWSWTAANVLPLLALHLCFPNPLPSVTGLNTSSVWMPMSINNWAAWSPPPPQAPKAYKGFTYVIKFMEKKGTNVASSAKLVLQQSRFFTDLTGGCFEMVNFKSKITKCMVVHNWSGKFSFDALQPCDLTKRSCGCWHLCFIHSVIKTHSSPVNSCCCVFLPSQRQPLIPSHSPGRPLFPIVKEIITIPRQKPTSTANS